MRVALLTREYPPEVYGGAGVHVDYLSRALADRADNGPGSAAAMEAMSFTREDGTIRVVIKNLYADTSALHYRPWRHYQAFMTALEYGVEHKLIFGSDFPS